MKKIDSVGEAQEMQFGSYQTNAYKRQVRLKLLGLEELNKLTQLAAALRPDAAANPPAAAPAAEAPSGLGGMLGRLMGAARRDVAVAKEEAKDNLGVTIVEGGGPHDKPGSAVADVLVQPSHVTGSVFGAKLNNKTRVTVTAEDFKPRLIFMRYKQKGMFDNGTDAEAPEYLVESSAAVEEEGDTKVTMAYDNSRKPPEGTIGNVLIVVTSADGKATSGRYRVRYSLGQ
jgi:hypothetical protein